MAGRLFLELTRIDIIKFYPTRIVVNIYNGKRGKFVQERDGRLRLMAKVSFRPSGPFYLLLDPLWVEGEIDLAWFWRHNLWFSPTLCLYEKTQALMIMIWPQTRMALD